MPDVKDELLRIHCLCGQKMKVSERMYGMPGKCIACRQKIRIPRRDELPEGVTEIYLKDYPDLLREPPRVETPMPGEEEASEALKAAGDAPKSEDEPTPNTELDLADSPSPAEPREKKRSGGTVAIDVLPMLQILCSLEYKFERQLRAARDEDSAPNGRTAELEGHLSRVQNLRGELDDYLHQLLMEAAIELSSTQEQIAKTKLEGRTGEQTWPEYQETMRRLRSRRDRLERRQQNLRGWLGAKDPYAAGGLLDLSVENIPEEGFTVSVPSEPEDGGSLLASHLDGLRGALEARVSARERAEAVRRMETDRSTTAIGEVKREAETERRFARARVAFYSDRLERLKRDCTIDQETADAQLTTARDRLKADEITRDQYDFVEKETLSGKKDLARMQALVTRALSANVAADVPNPRGTLFNRLAVGSASARPVDMWVAWGAAALLIVSIFLPLIGTSSLYNAYQEFKTVSDIAAWCVAAPVVLAVVVIALSFAPAAVRGVALLSAGAVGAIALMFLLHESGYSLDSMAARFRSGPAWFLRPGMLVLGLGLLGTLGAGSMALWPEPSRRAWIAGAIGVVVLAGATVFSDVAGAFRPDPRLEVIVSETEPGAGVIQVRNDGGRAMHLLDRPTDARGSYLFLVERRVGVASFGDAMGEGPLWDASNSDERGVMYTVPPGGMQITPFTLPPDEYRALLENEQQEIAQPFVIEPPRPIEQPIRPPETLSPAPPPTAADPGILPEPPGPRSDPAEPVPDEAVEPVPDDPVVEANPPAFEVNPDVELVGILTSQDESPRFTFSLRFPDGTEERVVTPLGGNLWGDWKVDEYNPEQRTVTLGNQGRILIVRRGSAQTLELQ